MQKIINKVCIQNTIQVYDCLNKCNFSLRQNFGDGEGWIAFLQGSALKRCGGQIHIHLHQIS